MRKREKGEERSLSAVRRRDFLTQPSAVADKGFSSGRFSVEGEKRSEDCGDNYGTWGEQRHSKAWERGHGFPGEKTTVLLDHCSNCTQMRSVPRFCLHTETYEWEESGVF